MTLNIKSILICIELILIIYLLGAIKEPFIPASKTHSDQNDNIHLFFYKNKNCKSSSLCKDHICINNIKRSS
jgi:hypothetical protein